MDAKEIELPLLTKPPKPFVDLAQAATYGWNKVELVCYLDGRCTPREVHERFYSGLETVPFPTE